MKVEVKKDYEAVLIDTIGNLSDALARKKVFADDFARNLAKDEETIRQLTANLRALTVERDRWKKDHGDNLSAYNDSGREIAKLKREVQGMRDRLDIALGKLREIRRRKR